MLNLDQKGANKLIIALVIAVFLCAACALSGWLVAFAAGYSHSLAAKNTAETQTDLDRCARDLEEAEEVATQCLDDNDSSLFDLDDYGYDDEEICGTKQGNKTVFDDEALQIFFETDSSVECVDVSTYSDTSSQYIYVTGDTGYFSAMLSSYGSSSYYDQGEGYELIDTVTVETADGFLIDLRTFKYESDEYSYYNVNAVNQPADADLGLSIYGSAYSEENAAEMVEIISDFVASIKFNKARG